MGNGRFGDRHIPKILMLTKVFHLCGSSAQHNADDTIARQTHMLELWTRLAKCTFEMSDTTHSIKAYRSHDMQHKHESVMACMTKLKQTYRVAQQPESAVTAAIKTMLADGNWNALKRLVEVTG